MTPKIIGTGIKKILVGAATKHEAQRSYGEEIMMLMNQLYPVVQAKAIKTTGINHVAYGADDEVFAGVEVVGAMPPAPELKEKEISIGRHAYWKHVGPYQLLGGVHAELNEALAAMGLKTGRPILEIYGHWNQDESKLETEIFYPLA